MSGQPKPPKPKALPGLKREDTASLNPFTVDGTSSLIREVPSINRLLNRRTLERDKQQKKSAEKEAPPKKEVTAHTPAVPQGIDAPAVDEKSGAGLIELGVSSPAPAQASQKGMNEIAISEDSSPLQLDNHILSAPAPAASSSENSQSGTDIEMTEEPGGEAPAEPAAESGPAPGVRVQRATRRQRAGKLITWDEGSLRYANDPLAKGLTQLLARGARSALFLAISVPRGGTSPIFLATAAVKPASRLAIWTGVTWDPAVVPEVWNQFVHTGYVELSPPGTSTNIKSARNVIRTAIGVAAHEFLILVRVGESTACRGVLAVISAKSMLDEVVAVVPVLSQLPAQAA